MPELSPQTLSCIAALILEALSIPLQGTDPSMELECALDREVSLRPPKSQLFVTSTQQKRPPCSKCLKLLAWVTPWCIDKQDGNLRSHFCIEVL
jgi:hypothetical protein